MNDADEYQNAREHFEPEPALQFGSLSLDTDMDDLGLPTLAELAAAAAAALNPAAPDLAALAAAAALNPVAPGRGPAAALNPVAPGPAAAAPAVGWRPRSSAS